MTLTQLRYFIAICDSGLNITLAAERVHATQPGLSKQLKLLEESLGFLLFTRKGRSLENITPDGTHVLIHARRMLLEARNIRAYAANARGEQAGKLVIVTTPTQARYVLPHPITLLKNKYPGVSVHLQSHDEGEVLRSLNSDHADLAIISTSGAKPTGGFAIALYSWKRIAVVPKGHPLASTPDAITIAELADHPIISYESALRPDSSLQRGFLSGGYTPNIALTANEADLIKTYTRAGLGVGILAEMAHSCMDEDLLARHLPAAIVSCITWAVLPQDQVLRAYVLDLLCDIAPQLDRVDIQRAIAGEMEYAAPTPPSWIELTQAITV
jgi:LysR family transcriptional regulator, cys regulon transcriptional activator